MSWALLSGGMLSLVAQTPPNLKGSTGSLTRFHPAPHFRQVEFRLTGDSISQLPENNKQYRATNPQFASFSTNGTPIITISAPECILDETDPTKRTVSSDQELLLRTGDGQSSIQGRGWRWNQFAKTLIISNNVRALIKWTNNAPPLEITSRWLEFDVENRRGIFHEAVRGDNPDLTFTCAQLTLSGGSSNSLELVEADGDLEILRKVGTGRARAKRGTYRHSNQQIELIGNADWKFDNYAGSADRMTTWLSNTNIDATGNVKLSMPSSSLGAAIGMLNSTNAAPRTTNSNIITLTTDRFTRRGPDLLAEGAVRINDGTNTLRCDRLEGKQTTAESPNDTAAAIGNVFVGRDDNGVYSERADYSQATGQVLFTGKNPPRFIQGQTSGTAGRIIARPATGEVLAEQGVKVKLTFASKRGDTFLNVLPNARTNQVARNNRTNQVVQVTAQNFSLHDQLALFSGNVVAQQLPASGAESRMRADELEVRLAANKRDAESVQARNNVICERGLPGMTNGPAELVYSRMDCKTLTAQTDINTGEMIDLVAVGDVQLLHASVNARGERAIYTRGDQLVKLLGKSVIENPQIIYSSDQNLTWNLVTEKIVGDFIKISAKPAALPPAEKLLKLPGNE